MEAGVLDGLSVLELTSELPGAQCGALLALLGAEVVKAESARRPDRARLVGPFPDGAVDREHSGLHRYLNARKRSVGLDVSRPSGRAVLDRLAAGADVLLDDGALGRPPAVAATYAGLLGANERLIVVAFSPYGLDGPKAGWVSTELTALAASGWLKGEVTAHDARPESDDARPGDDDVRPGAEPLMPGSSAPALGVGTLGAIGVLLALTARRRSGRGQLVEVPEQEALLSLLPFPTAMFAYLGHDHGRLGDRHPYGIYPCSDGHLGVSILTQGHWEALCRLMDRADLADDLRLADGELRAQPDAGGAHRCRHHRLGGRQGGPADVRGGPGQGRAGDDHPLAPPGAGLRPVRGPGLLERPLRRGPGPAAPPRSALPGGCRDVRAVPRRPPLGRGHRGGPRPCRGRRRAAIGSGRPGGAVRRAERAEPGGASANSPDGDGVRGRSPRRALTMAGAGVLDGVRVLDLTAWQAGPILTMILGDFGAEVLKIEASTRLDGWRGSAGMLEDGAYERSPIWLAINRSKRGLSLDLTTPKGRDLFLRLVADADVVVENFTARVMAKLGLAYETLRVINERLVMISLSGFGASGPWRDFAAFAFPTEQVSGLTYLNGRPGGPPLAIGQSVTDALAGTTGAFAVLAALERRARTGRGDRIDLSQIETLTSLIGGELIEAQLSGRDPRRQGNQRPGFEPQGLFPCLPPERWVAISCRSDEEWQHLCRVMGRADLAEDAGLVDIGGRSAQRERVHEAVRAWTGGRPPSPSPSRSRRQACPPPPSPGPSS